MAESTLGQAIVFFEKIGVYDVILPFILVFVIMFALFERTKIFGTEKLNIGGKDRDLSKKGLNSMAAFVIAFFCVASSKIVETISTVSANMVILVIMIVFLLMLVGQFYKEGDIGTDGIKNEPIKVIFLSIVCFAIVLIFLDGIKNDAGVSWLEIAWRTVLRYWDSAAFASLALMGLIILFVWFVAGSPHKTEGAGGKDAAHDEHGGHP